MADKKVSELSAITNLSGDDLLLVVNDPSGTPTSNKVTVSNLFANVVPNVIHKGTVTARANTTFSGTTMTVSANLVLSGTNVLNAINDRIQVANATLLFNDRVQVANAVLLNRVEEQRISSNVHIASSNSITGVSILNGSIVVRATELDPGSMTFYSTSINSANAEFAKSTQLIPSIQSALANNVVLTLPVSNGTLALASTVDDRIQIANATAQFANSADSILTGDTTAVSITSNTVTIQANTGLVLAGGGLTDQVPATSNATSEGIAAGTIWYSNNHLYIAVDSNTIKRINLSTF